MRSVTPFFSITASSSFFTSSKVKPYWKPEQPPPVTNTRSLSSGLPSSSIRLFTLFAALSLNSSGEGISEETSGVTLSVTAFISCAPESLALYYPPNHPPRLPTRGELQFHALGFGAVVHQAPFNHGALMDFQALVI